MRECYRKIEMDFSYPPVKTFFSFLIFSLQCRFFYEHDKHETFEDRSKIEKKKEMKIFLLDTRNVIIEFLSRGCANQQGNRSEEL